MRANVMIDGGAVPFIRLTRVVYMVRKGQRVKKNHISERNNDMMCEENTCEKMSVETSSAFD